MTTSPSGRQPLSRARRAVRIPAPIGLVAALFARPASAETSFLPAATLQRLADSPGLLGVTVMCALMVFSVITLFMHLTGRTRWLRQEGQILADLADARARLDRASVFLGAEQQIIVAWAAADGEPDIEGELSLVTDAPVRRRVLGFGSWLPPESAQQLERCVERLRGRGEGFRLPVVSLAGRHLETDGRAIAGHAVLRIRDVSGERLELTRQRDRHARLAAEMDGLKGLFDALPAPMWMRGPDGRLAWVNRAYARAVEAKDGAAAVAEGIEFLDRSARDAAGRLLAERQTFQARVPAVVAGARHLMDVTEVPSSAGSAGFSHDRSDMEALRAEVERGAEAHKRTLDQLPTAVAIFDRSYRLVFHNQVFRALWALDAAFLDGAPGESELLDRLRALHRLPEQADFRAWRSQIMDASRAMEPEEQVWYLPDGRTLRTVIDPNPVGGATWLFDDVTERFDLAAKLNALIRVQGETLDALQEGVAVFGSNGRLKLFNPAFATLWRLDGDALAARLRDEGVPMPHIEEVARLCAPLGTPDGWDGLRAVVAGLHDARTGFKARFARVDTSVVDCAAAPLPDGATLLAFTDVSANVHVEKALIDRNDALTAAETLRNDFVHHVSYELRSPLTNIIGFTQFLAEGGGGTLNDKQHEYVGYVMKSSSALLAIIDDILDLATIDTDAMRLDLGPVDIRDTIAAAARGVQDRLDEQRIRLDIVTLDGVGTFEADGKRIRQILFNLLSNAIGFSSSGQAVTLAALRRGDSIVFKVSDQGRGISPETIAQVFERFHSRTDGTRHRGVGLGLTIVRALVELHGGRITIDSAPGEGTTVTCILPAAGAARVAAVA